MSNSADNTQNGLDISQLLVSIIALLGRATFPEESLRQIISPMKQSGKHLTAYNLCDGTRTRPEVYKAAKLDKDNFNKTVKKWIQKGAVFEIKQGNRVVLQHLYELPPLP
jgi:hypothetical protein